MQQHDTWREIGGPLFHQLYPFLTYLLFHLNVNIPVKTDLIYLNKASPLRQCGMNVQYNLAGQQVDVMIAQTNVEHQVKGPLIIKRHPEQMY